MSHRWDCPDDYEARSKARRDASFDLSYGSGDCSYRRPFDDCDHANEEYRRAYRSEFEHLAEERRIEQAAKRRREYARQEQEDYERQYYESQEQRREESAFEEQAYYAEMECCTYLGEILSQLSPRATPAPNTEDER